MAYTFPAERTCPQCGKPFSEAEQKAEFEPVVVVVCPHCGEMLWKPGLDEDAPLHPYDPNADAGGF